MSQNNLITATVTLAASFGTDEYILALGERDNATIEEIEAACEAHERIVARQKEALAKEEALRREAEEAEAKKAEAEIKTKEAIAKVEQELRDREWKEFQAAREEAAKEFFHVKDNDVANALLGKGHPRWGRGVLNNFLARFPEGKRGRFHDLVEGVLVVIDEIIKEEEANEEKAERIRQEAKKRQEKNRRDRAAAQSRSAKGGGGKKK